MKNTTTEDEKATLTQARDRIQSALAEMRAAENLQNQVAANHAMREQRFNIALAELNPADEVGLAKLAVERQELSVLREWLDRSTRLRFAVQTLRASLHASAPAIRACAQHRSSEEGTIFKCFWRDNLDRPASLSSLEDQTRLLADTTRSVLSDISIVLAAVRPAILSQSERQGGVLRDGSAVVRHLTTEERISGVAVA